MIEVFGLSGRETPAGANTGWSITGLVDSSAADDARYLLLSIIFMANHIIVITGLYVLRWPHAAEEDTEKQL